MKQEKIEKTWLSIKKLNRKWKNLKKEFYETHKTDKNGDYPADCDFDDKLEPLAKKYNTNAFSLIREILKRDLGDTYKGIYPAAGEETLFCQGVGGEWYFLDRAYNNKIEKITDEGPFVEHFEAVAITHDFLSGELPEGIESASFDLSLLRHPFGVPLNLAKHTKYKPPKKEPPEPAYGPGWWNGLLMHCVTPLRKGGILISESPLETVRDKEPEVRDTIDSYLNQLNKMENLLGLGTDRIHIVEYREREASTEPRSPGYFFYKKL